jgi:hypothetical protein
MPWFDGPEKRAADNAAICPNDHGFRAMGIDDLY